MARQYQRFLPVLLPLLLGACAPGPKLAPAKMSAPSHYLHSPDNWSAHAQQLSWQQAPSVAWWRRFGSTTLDQDVQTALAANPSIRQAQSAVLRAQQIEIEAAAGFMPQVSANAQLERSRALRTGADGGTRYRIPGNLYSMILGSVAVSYSPDLFGRTSDQVHSAQAQKQVAAARLQATQQYVAAAVAKALISVAAAREQWQSAQRIADADAKLLQLIRQEYHLGASNLQVLRQQQALTASARAAVIPLRVAMEKQQHALAVLLGKYPERRLEIPALQTLHLPKDLPVVVPSTLLEQRPDIVAARAAVSAAAAEAHLAAANRYPRINIGADLGKAAQSGALFFNPASTLWGIAGSIIAPIYTGGALRAQEKAAVDTYQMAVEQYHGVVLAAFRQVADALRALQGADQSYTQRRIAATAAKQALELAQARYRDGVTDYATVLNAEIANQQDQEAVLRAESERYLDSVALFLAMDEGPGPTPHSSVQETQP